MVCDEVCVKDDDVSEAGGGRMVCYKDVRERIVDKDCMKDAEWQHIETNGVWQRWYVTDGVWQRCVWDGLWNQGGCHLGVTPATQNESRCDEVPRRHVKRT